eukprot:7011041-Pyramimonas_sp.AAC.1
MTEPLGLWWWATQDGRSSALTAPNGPAQQAAVSAAMRRAGLAPSLVSLLQLHGTGTALGDPIEVGAAAAVLLTKRSVPASDLDGANSSSRPLVLAALKASAGHTEAGAGAFALAHTLAAWSKQFAPRLTQLRALSGHVAAALTSSHADPCARATSMPRTALAANTVGTNADGFQGTATTVVSLSAGASSFAFQGTNAHALVAAPAGANSFARGSLAGALPRL